MLQHNVRYEINFLSGIENAYIHIPSEILYLLSIVEYHEIVDFSLFEISILDFDEKPFGVRIFEDQLDLDF